MESRTCAAVFLFAAVLLHASIIEAQMTVNLSFKKNPSPPAPKPVVNLKPAGGVPQQPAKPAVPQQPTNLAEKAPGRGSIPQGTRINHKWCIPRPTSTAAQLEANIKQICEDKRIFCTPINPGGQCFENNNIWVRASYAMNSYFRLIGKCDFNQTGAVSLTDPSFGTCKFL